MTTVASTRPRTVGARYTLLGPAMTTDGVGTVWHARDELLHRDVAIREVVMPPGLTSAERQKLCARSVAEARTAATLRHPSVVPICDVVVEGERAWIVMEVVAGRSLYEIVRDEGPLPSAVVADIGLHVLGALEAAHAAGILHRNVKPGNILLDRDRRATLTGFGVARTSGDAALTSAGLALCAPPYIPPERARGDEPTPASDLWSLGAVLYTAVEGQPPFDAGDPMSTLAAILADPAAPAQRAGPLGPVLDGLLEKEPAKRWDVDRARAGLRAVLTGQDPTKLRSLTPTRARPPAPAPSTKDMRLPIGLVIAATAVLVAALVMLAMSGGTKSTVNLKPAASAGSVPAPGARPAPTQLPSASDINPATLPGIYYRLVDPRGFALFVPQSWIRQENANGDWVLRDPDHGRILEIQRVLDVGGSIRDYWNAGDADQQTRPGYHRLAITDTHLAQYPGADWEFTRSRDTTGASGTQQAISYTIGRGAVIDGRAYLIYLSMAQRDFAASRPIIDRVSASFRLTQ